MHWATRRSVALLQDIITTLASSNLQADSPGVAGGAPPNLDRPVGGPPTWSDRLEAPHLGTAGGRPLNLERSVVGLPTYYAKYDTH